MPPDQIRDRLRELAGELSKLREAEAAAGEKLEEAHVTLEAIDAERWQETGRGDLAAAIREYTKVQQRHRQAADRLEENLREAAKLRGAGGTR